MGPMRAVILDLDGTLLDTAGEIGAAMDRTLDELGIERVPLRRLEAMIGRGVRTLVERAIAHLGAKNVDIERAVQRFEAHYAQTVGTTAVPFDGVVHGVQRMHESGLRLGVVTNKPRFFTMKLLEGAQIARYFDTVVAGDDGIAKKPAGDMLVAACRAMKSEARQTLMLGDSDNDVLAARAAGCPVWCVPYGYNEGRPVETLACDRIVATVEEAARLLERAV
jgi:phosphoglycolate phosphatase